MWSLAYIFPFHPDASTLVGRNDSFLGWWLSQGMLLIKKTNSKLLNAGIYKNYVRFYEKFSAFIYSFLKINVSC